MKVFDIRCHLGHLFEGWFDSEDDYQSQKKRGLLLCPVCESHEVEKMPSAVRMLSGAHATPVEESAQNSTQPAAAQGLELAKGPLSRQDMARMQAQWLQALRQVVQQSEDVGTRFAQEARSMHTGDVPERPIRGQTTWQEAQELLEEGISVLPIPGTDVVNPSLH